jgi:hypothetical protein
VLVRPDGPGRAVENLEKEYDLPHSRLTILDSTRLASTEKPINMNMKIALLALLALPCRDACPLSHLEGENPHKATGGDDDELIVVKHIAARQLQDRFTGSSEQAIDAARDDILDIVQANPRLGPKFVRLGFHDCVGGCDGCVDMNNPANSGLHLPMDALLETVNFYQNQLTGADVWALAALASADAMQRNAPGRVPYTFDYYGRDTCPDTRGGPSVDMPSNHITTEDLLDFFAAEFGFDTRQTVAIMGAHTL